MQALYLLALDPISETSADRNSYGFRPVRSAADAIEQCFVNLSRKSSAEWVLEGDIKGGFDNISHNWLLANIPLDKQVLGKWLKAGFMESGRLHPTEAGTPQGGIITPVLANMALDGLEAVLEPILGRKTPKPGTKPRSIMCVTQMILSLRVSLKSCWKMKLNPSLKPLWRSEGCNYHPKKQ